MLKIPGLLFFLPLLKIQEGILIGRRTPRPPAGCYVNQDELALSRCSKMPQVIFRAFQSSSAWMLCLSPAKGIAMIYGKLLFHVLCVSFAKTRNLKDSAKSRQTRITAILCVDEGVTRFLCFFFSSETM